ncbi:hypothetical protein [Mycolicibacterium baixiangningiae]|uniref:hypothetical protein n=1 Tax=Mycolicibacterium baixiangningiae TaxID=2761578 RepID=UPI001E3035A3|nr:hypothetical protein [Mycolicibacterium baixiangningiae]
MLVIIGLIVLGAAVIVGVVGSLSNAGPTHQLTETFSVFGYSVTGSTGTLFLFGIAVGAVAALGLGVLLAGARRAADRGREARRQLAVSQRETAFINRDRATLPEHQRPCGAGVSSATASRSAPTAGPRTGALARWRGRQLTKTARGDRDW